MKSLLLILAVVVLVCPVPLFQYYCGFGGDYCGQSTTDDTHPNAQYIILAFADIGTDGTVAIDQPNYPTALVSKWQSLSKSVLISIGGQNANWSFLFATTTSINLALNSIAAIITKFNLDGIDLDLEAYNTDPTIVSAFIHDLKTLIGPKKLLTIAPECVGIYTGSPYTPGVWNSWNYWVPIINSTISDIDFVLVQAYNNWYEQPSGTLAYIQDVYVNWQNQPSHVFCNWCTPIPEFKGVPDSKLVLGIISSTSAGNGGYYLPPAIIQSFISWTQTSGYKLAGIMFWNSHWDSINGFAVSNAIAQVSQKNHKKKPNLLQD